MKALKIIAIVAAIAVNLGVLVAFDHLGTTTFADVPPPPVHTSAIVTLPTITVRPTPAQIQVLRGEGAWPAPATTASTARGEAGMRTLLMPYFSFGNETGA